MNKSSSFLIGSIACAMSGYLSADVYHYNNVLVGNRASGMGGAYTAIADDASGLYHNPAGIVYSPGANLSASVNAYNMQTTEYSNINKGGFTWKRESSGMLANYFGIYQSLGPGMVGFSIAIPDSIQEDQDEEFRNFQAADAKSTVTRFLSNHNYEDTTTLLGPSFAMAVNNSFSFGATLYFHMRKMELTQHQLVHVEIDNPQQRTVTMVNGAPQYWVYTDPDKKDSTRLPATYTSAEALEQVRIGNGRGIEIAYTGSATSVSGTRTAREETYSKSQTTETGFRPIIGMMWTPIERLSVGLNISKTFMINQNPQTQDSRFSDTWIDKSGDTTVIGIYDQLVQTSESELANAAERTLPWQTSVGVAYFPSENTLFSADIDYSAATDNLEATINAAVGAEIFLSRKWAVRGGLYTNNSNTPSKIGTGTNYVGPHVDMTGLSASVSRYDKDSTISAGMIYAGGSGQERLDPYSNRIQDVKVTSTALFVSTSAAY